MVAVAWDLRAVAAVAAAVGQRVVAEVWEGWWLQCVGGPPSKHGGSRRKPCTGGGGGRRGQAGGWGSEPFGWRGRGSRCGGGDTRAGDRADRALTMRAVGVGHWGGWFWRASWEAGMGHLGMAGWLAGVGELGPSIQGHLLYSSPLAPYFLWSGLVLDFWRWFE